MQNSFGIEAVYSFVLSESILIAPNSKLFLRHCCNNQNCLLTEQQTITLGNIMPYSTCQGNWQCLLMAIRPRMLSLCSWAFRLCTWKFICVSHVLPCAFSKNISSSIMHVDILPSVTSGKNVTTELKSDCKIGICLCCLTPSTCLLNYNCSVYTLKRCIFSTFGTPEPIDWQRSELESTLVWLLATALSDEF